MSEVDPNPELDYFKCTICQRDDFKTVRDMLAHMDIHNAKDPELNISVVAEREAFVNRTFG